MSCLSVTILNRQRKVSVDRSELESLIARAVRVLEDQEQAAGEVSLVLVSDRRIRQLNRDFADIDAPTDVLSFSALEGGMELEEEDLELGDIVVSVETAERQVGHKDRSGHPRTRTLTEELTLLFVHGALHLLGHDHSESEETREMLEREQRVMDQIRSKGSKA